MTNLSQFHSSRFDNQPPRNNGLRRIINTAVVFCALTTVMARPASAQTFTVLHSFTANSDGYAPGGTGVTIDRAGNLYGGTDLGGLSGCYFDTCGVVYKLSRRQTGWVFSTLYEFHNAAGATPDAPVVIGPDGALYGTTFYGGIDSQGVVYRLQPPLTACKTAVCYWTESVLYAFTGGNDGAHPAFGALTFDAAGNLYGTTTGDELPNYGNVYELVHSNGQWTFNPLYSFTGELDGGEPWSGVIFDAAGNLYGTTSYGGQFRGGTAYELSPSGGGWTLTPLHEFVPDTNGDDSFGNLVFGASGNLLGTNRSGGPGGAGTVFELTPHNTVWSLTTLATFTGPGGPQASVAIDQAGNLYGTTVAGGLSNDGVVFKLTPSGSGYTYSELHHFTGFADGANPYGQIVLDADGNLYGATESGGIRSGNCPPNGCGVVWEITP